MATPHPKNTNTNVPITSAAYFFIVLLFNGLKKGHILIIPAPKVKAARVAENVISGWCTRKWVSRQSSTAALSQKKLAKLFI
jgi:hypothetical protein